MHGGKGMMKGGKGMMNGGKGMMEGGTMSKGKSTETKVTVSSRIHVPLLPNDLFQG